jgi:hypothetical protein
LEPFSGVRPATDLRSCLHPASQSRTIRHPNLVRERSVIIPYSVLAFTAAAFIGFGCAFTFWPGAMAGVVDLGLPTATARVDLAATYGGFELGFGSFLLLCLRRPVWWLEAGLWAGAMALAGFAAVRLATLLLIGAPVRPAIYLALALEVGGVILNVWGLRVVRRSRQVTS